MAGPNDKQNKNIARAKLRQAQEKERAAKAAARKRTRVIAGVVAALLVIGAGFGATQLLGGDEDPVTATDDASGSPDDEVRDTTPPAPEGKANCVYATEDTEDTGGKKVDKPPLVAEAENPYTVKITTNKGPVELKLNSKDAPCAVNSFAHLAKKGFYDGTTCHRALIEDGYGILQCGDPTGSGSGGAGYSFRDENLEGAEYMKGTLAMANHGANTNGSQFFLVFRDSSFPAAYTPFGTIEKDSSFKTLESIADDGTTTSDQGSKDKPKKTVKIEKMTVTGPTASSSDDDEDASPSPSPSKSSKPAKSPSPSPSSGSDEDEDESPSPSPSSSKGSDD